MNHAISPVASDLAEHYRAFDQDEAYRSDVDRRTADIRAELDGGDWEYLEELVTNGPDRQRELFWREALQHLLPAGHGVHAEASRVATRASSRLGSPENITRPIRKHR